MKLSQLITKKTSVSQSFATKSKGLKLFVKNASVTKENK